MPEWDMNTQVSTLSKKCSGLNECIENIFAMSKKYLG